MKKTLITGVWVLHLGPIGYHKSCSACEHSHSLPCPSLSQNLKVFESILFSALNAIMLEKPCVGAAFRSKFLRIHVFLLSTTQLIPETGYC